MPQIINEEIKKKIEVERNLYCKKHGRMTTGYYAINFDAGAEFGYLLSQSIIEEKENIIKQFVQLRSFFHKGSPLTNMMDKIIKDNNR